ncbi:MAG TPA: Gfo/Idh/MocA family oxidoreductase [Vicinamibacterales bacterium]|jgi:predicted dehydrogenase|nr:Gfo/Idh/MocA family oxidoreductase [Vicinamibacterales bacterium]
MARQRVDRRTFVKAMAGSTVLPALAAGGTERAVAAARRSGVEQSGKPRLKFAVIGINHNHINSQVAAVLRGGGELVWLYAKEPDLVKDFQTRFPQAKLARSENEVLQDSSIQLVLSSAIPSERAPIGVRVMQHGKDYMSDKPGITTLEQLAEVKRVQAKTRRIYSIMYSERLENQATIRAAELVKAGAIGHVVQTIGLGPHRMAPATRPAWFFEKPRYGGILCDIASHQADQFLYFTGSTRAEVVSAQVGNVHFPQYPNFEDFGDMMVRGDSGAGYIRVDWFTPDGLSTWGDTRLTVLGTDGFIEVRKNVDIAGRPGESHLFLVDQKETRYIDCSKVPLSYGEQLVNDVLNRTETAMTQAHCYLATELVLKAQQQAQRLAFRA